MNASATAEKLGRSADRVYDQIKLMAMTYEFRPGERINEVDLATRLSVSRTPVREALNRLSSEGFLTMLPNRGFYGRLLDAKEIYSLYEFRCLLEQSIVRLACERATDAELEELAAFARSTGQAKDETSILQRLHQDEEFHLRVARLTRNAEFERCLEGINSRIHFVRWLDLRKRGISSDGHRQIVRLLKQRDPDRCSAHMAAMLRHRYEEILEVIKEGVVEIYVSRTSPASPQRKAARARADRG